MAPRQPQNAVFDNGAGSVERHLGGNQWFLSPGLMWTHQNFAFKAGLQLPVIDDLSADQEQDDYRAKIELEWHL
ncbi:MULTISPECIES: hypothetical protein [Thalassolituus]|uniref:hypothetical protein n=1 Tax=Thalassolituus TaxID=187492 RepID=UPI00260F6EBA|nr:MULTISPECIES: hypothetical protein [Thalassolituus]